MHLNVTEAHHHLDNHRCISFWCLRSQSCVVQHRHTELWSAVDGAVHPSVHPSVTRAVSAIPLKASITEAPLSVKTSAVSSAKCTKYCLCAYLKLWGLLKIHHLVAGSQSLAFSKKVPSFLLVRHHYWAQIHNNCRINRIIHVCAHK